MNFADAYTELKRGQRIAISDHTSYTLESNVIRAWMVTGIGGWIIINGKVKFKAEDIMREDWRVV